MRRCAVLCVMVVTLVAIAYCRAPSVTFARGLYERNRALFEEARTAWLALPEEDRDVVQRRALLESRLRQVGVDGVFCDRGRDRIRFPIWRGFSLTGGVACYIIWATDAFWLAYEARPDPTRDYVAFGDGWGLLSDR